MTEGRSSPSGDAAGVVGSGVRSKNGNKSSSPCLGADPSLDVARRGFSEIAKGSNGRRTLFEECIRGRREPGKDASDRDAKRRRDWIPRGALRKLWPTTEDMSNNENNFCKSIQIIIIIDKINLFHQNSKLLLHKVPAYTRLYIRKFKRGNSTGDSMTLYYTLYH